MFLKIIFLTSKYKLCLGLGKLRNDTGVRGLAPLVLVRVKSVNPGAPGKIDLRGLHSAQKIVKIEFLL